MTTGEEAVAGSFDLSWNLTVESDPTLSGSFTLTNLSSMTQTFSVSATLGGSPVSGPTAMGGSFGDLTYTDANLSGSVAVDTAPSTPFYQASIDGGSVEDSGPLHVGATGAGGGPLSGTFAKQSWGTPIPSAPGPGVTSTIGVSFPGFMLTGGDELETRSSSWSSPSPPRWRSCCSASPACAAPCGARSAPSDDEDAAPR